MIHSFQYEQIRRYLDCNCVLIIYYVYLVHNYNLDNNYIQHLHNNIQCQPKEMERLLLIGKMAACTLNEILAENLVMKKYFLNMMP